MSFEDLVIEARSLSVFKALLIELQVFRTKNLGLVDLSVFSSSFLLNGILKDLIIVTACS